ncbi:hypothetical protein [Aquimarina sp. BL5]|uniref:hypothetical protein n=1 Tax=Aquimarina sp. BL5 TaxID=1714860 RepID=UPI0011C3EC01|nr:hypothetical protein [Aquimarina sp. BL5]
MKNLRILSLLILGLMVIFTSCEENDDTDPTTECPELSFERDGGKLIANFEEINSLDVYEWFVNDELIETERLEDQRDNTLDISEYNPGTYTVCIKAETPDCPAGVEFCKEIVVGEDMEGCPELKFTRDGDYLIADFEGIDTLEFYAWQVTGETLDNEVIIENEGTDNQGDNKFSLVNLEEGTYTICLISESPTCTSTEYCEEISIDRNGQDSCPDLAFTREGEYLIADFEGIADLGFYAWKITGEVLGNETLIENEGLDFQGDNKFLLSTLEAGKYTVCLISESPTCTQAEPFCKEIEVGDTNNGSCPDLSFIEEGTLMFANFSGIDQLDVYEWFVNGTLVETESLQSQDRDDKLDLSSYNPGTYTVCIKAETNECPNGTEFCRDIVIPEPEPVDCSVFKLEYFETNTAEFVNANGVILFGLDNNSVVWEIDGNQVTPTTATGHFLILQDHLTQTGRYEICYKAESSECGSLQECIQVDFQGI